MNDRTYIPVHERRTERPKMHTRRKQWSRSLLGIMAALLLTTMLGVEAVSRPLAAHAGTNGQQLQVTCSQAASIVVIGVNENGQEVTQSFYPDTSGGTTFTTNGWWWVGPVTILWYGPNGTGSYY